jgi:hypothetical protein
MNEKIEKLLEQCHRETYGVNGELLEFGFDAEKFAELFVQECLEELRYTVLDTQELRRDKSTDYQVGWEDGMFDAGETIKNIFGVD